MLEKMTEKEREQVIYNRSEKRDALRTRSVIAAPQRFRRFARQGVSGIVLDNHVGESYDRISGFAPNIGIGSADREGNQF